MRLACRDPAYDARLRTQGRRRATRRPGGLPARRRLTAPSCRAPTEDKVSSGSPTSMPAKLNAIPNPTMTLTTVNTKPTIAGGRLRTRYQRSFRARRFRRTCGR